MTALAELLPRRQARALHSLTEPSRPDEGLGVEQPYGGRGDAALGPCVSGTQGWEMPSIQGSGRRGYPSRTPKAARVTPLREPCQA